MTRNKKLILIIVTLALVVAISFGTAYAFITYFSVEDGFKARAGKDSFVVNSANAYHAEITAVNILHSVTITKKTTDSSVNSFDLLVFGSASVTATALGNNIVNKPLDNGMYCTIFSGVAYGSQPITSTITFSTASAMKVVAVPHYEKNFFVSNIFELQMCNDEKLESNYAYEKYIDVEYADYANIYLIQDLTIAKETTITASAYVNLLYSNIVLDAPLTLHNPTRGIFSIDTISGKLSGVSTFTINAPLAFYKTADVALAMAEPTKLTVKCEVDFTTDTGAKTALISEASTFALGRIPNIIADDIVLIYNYGQYGVTYAYTATQTSGLSTINNAGAVTRGVSCGKVTINVDIIYKGVVVQQVSKNVVVVGTSADALSEALSLYTGNAITALGIMDNGVSRISDRVDFSTILYEGTRDLNNILSSVGTALDINISLSGTTSYLRFQYNGAEYKTITLHYDTTNKYQLLLGAQTITLTSNINLYLSGGLWVFENATENINFNYNNKVYSTVVNLKGVTVEQKKVYLKRYSHDIFINGITDSNSILSVKNEKIYFGDNSIVGNEIIPSALGYTAINYKVYLVSKVNFDKLQSGAMTLDAIVATGTDKSSDFDTTGGTIKPTSNSNLSIDEATDVLLVHISFNGTAESTFSDYCQMFIPAKGLGGSDYTEYISGDTFKEYFDGQIPGEKIKDGKLIDSVAGSTSYKFNSAYSDQVYLRMEFVDSSTYSNYCAFVDNKASGSIKEYWEINITVNNIPTTNTLVSLNAIFYVNTLGKEQIISTQPYSFVIPGIYKCGAGFTFTDNTFYNYIVGYKENGITKYESFNGYLLADGAKAEVARLTVTGLSQLGNINGVEVLSNTHSFVFDGVILNNISAFSRATGSITYLSMNSCGITTEMISNSALYSLKSLTELRLDNNAITSIYDATKGAYFYRTLKVLSLANQKITNTQTRCLVSINGIDKYPDLNTVYINGNAIKHFLPLVKCLPEKGKPKLQSVYIYDNIDNTSDAYDNTTNIPELIEMSKMYGTDGLVNKSVYVTLLMEKVKLYNKLSGSTPVELTFGKSTSSGQINDETKERAIAINSIIVGSQTQKTLNIPTSLTTINGGTPITYNVELYAIYKVGTTALLTHNGMEITGALTSGDRLNVIIRLCVSGTSNYIYREFEIMYKP